MVSGVSASYSGIPASNGKCLFLFLYRAAIVGRKKGWLYNSRNFRPYFQAKHNKRRKSTAMKEEKLFKNFCKQMD